MVVKELGALGVILPIRPRGEPSGVFAKNDPEPVRLCVCLGGGVLGTSVGVLASSRASSEPSGPAGSGNSATMARKAS